RPKCPRSKRLSNLSLRRTAEDPSQASQQIQLYSNGSFCHCDPDTDGLGTVFTSQRKNPASVFSVTREDTATKFPLCRNSQMFACATLSALGTRRALGLQPAVGQVTNLLQLAALETHCKVRFLVEGSGPLEIIGS